MDLHCYVDCVVLKKGWTEQQDADPMIGMVNKSFRDLWLGNVRGAGISTTTGLKCKYYDLTVLSSGFGHSSSGPRC
jgi:hypothetical protein